MPRPWRGEYELDAEEANVERKRRAVESQLTAMRLDLESEEEAALAEIAAAEARDQAMREDQVRMAKSRKSDAARTAGELCAGIQPDEPRTGRIHRSAGTAAEKPLLELRLYVAGQTPRCLARLQPAQGDVRGARAGELRTSR